VKVVCSELKAIAGHHRQLFVLSHIIEELEKYLALANETPAQRKIEARHQHERDMQAYVKAHLAPTRKKSRFFEETKPSSRLSAYEGKVKPKVASVVEKHFADTLEESSLLSHPHFPDYVEDTVERTSELPRGQLQAVLNGKKPPVAVSFEEFLEKVLRRISERICAFLLTDKELYDVQQWLRRGVRPYPPVGLGSLTPSCYLPDSEGWQAMWNLQDASEDHNRQKIEMQEWGGRLQLFPKFSSSARPPSPRWWRAIF